MAKNLSELPTSVLLNYQQLIEFGSREMYALFEHVTKQAEAGSVSKDYEKTLEASLRPKIEANNSVVEKIEKEIFSRIRNQFGRDVTLSNVMSKLTAGYEQEVERVKKMTENKPTIKKKGQFEVVKDDE